MTRVRQFVTLSERPDPLYFRQLLHYLRELFAAVWQAQEQNLIVACSDETTALTTGTAKVTFRMPWATRLYDVRASLTTAQTSGSTFTVDINVGSTPTSILGTKLTIDNTEKTSASAATAYTFASSDTMIDEDEEVTIDIDQLGDGTAKGLKVTFLGVRP